MFTLQLNGTDQNAMVVCSATGGYPPITNISLLKNGDVIASTASESTLQVNAAGISPSISRYGLYVCLVDLSGIPLQKTVILDKRGSYNVARFADLTLNVILIIAGVQVKFKFNDIHIVMCQLRWVWLTPTG